MAWDHRIGQLVAVASVIFPEETCGDPHKARASASWGIAPLQLHLQTEQAPPPQRCLPAGALTFCDLI